MQPPQTPRKPAIPSDDAWEISVTSTHEDHEYNPTKPVVHEDMTLRQLLDKYSITLGYQNVHLLEILTELMTTGKVCVEFRTFNERLQLGDFRNILSRPAAIELFNAYLTSRKAKTVELPKPKTRRITVQLPKIGPVTPRNTPQRSPPLP